MEAEELLNPLGVICYVTRCAGHLDDSYTVSLRALTICEKHFGEEGMPTCILRSKLGTHDNTFSSLVTRFSAP